MKGKYVQEFFCAVSYFCAAETTVAKTNSKDKKKTKLEPAIYPKIFGLTASQTGLWWIWKQAPERNASYPFFVRFSVFPDL
jgi:hypothetical protein